VQNTLQFAYALQKAGKPFEMMLYPSARHGVGDPQHAGTLNALRTRFILENL
jgi:dipeptidyl-peptidase-4